MATSTFMRSFAGREVRDDKSIHSLEIDGQNLVATKGDESTVNIPVLADTVTAIEVADRQLKYTKGDGTTETLTGKLSEDVGEWQPNEEVTVGTIRKTVGRGNAPLYFVCEEAGTTGDTQPTFTADDIQSSSGISIAEAERLENKIEQYGNIPCGTILPFSGSGDIPVGFLLCNGAKYYKATYPSLYETIGATYGGGTDDNGIYGLLPNLVDKFIQGSEDSISAEDGAYKEAGLPNITGQTNLRNMAIGGTASGAIWQLENTNSSSYVSTTGSSNLISLGLDASRSSSVYKNDCDTVQPPALQMRYIIKAFSGASYNTRDLAITKVANDVLTKADLDSPAFSGTPTCPTPSNSDSSQRIATTEWCNGSRLTNIVVDSSVSDGVGVYRAGDLCYVCSIFSVPAAGTRVIAYNLPVCGAAGLHIQDWDSDTLDSSTIWVNYLGQLKGNFAKANTRYLVSGYYKIFEDNN